MLGYWLQRENGLRVELCREYYICQARSESRTNRASLLHRRTGWVLTSLCILSRGHRSLTGDDESGAMRRSEGEFRFLKQSERQREEEKSVAFSSPGGRKPDSVYSATIRIRNLIITYVLYRHASTRIMPLLFVVEFHGKT